MFKNEFQFESLRFFPSSSGWAPRGWIDFVGQWRFSRELETFLELKAFSRYVVEEASCNVVVIDHGDTAPLFDSGHLIRNLNSLISHVAELQSVEGSTRRLSERFPLTFGDLHGAAADLKEWCDQVAPTAIDQARRPKPHFNSETRRLYYRGTYSQKIPGWRAADDVLQAVCEYFPNPCSPSICYPGGDADKALDSMEQHRKTINDWLAGQDAPFSNLEIGRERRCFMIRLKTQSATSEDRA